LLLVAFHVVGHDGDAGIRVDDDSPYRLFAESAVYLRMPLFAFLSGVVYAWRPLRSAEAYPGFMSRKAQRLLVPFVIFIPAIGIAQQVVPAANSATDLPFWGWFIFPLSPYWFLIAMFWVFALVAVADGWRLLERKSVVFAAIAAVFVLDIVVPVPDPTYDLLGLRDALFLLPFFLTGLAATRFDWRSVKPGWVLLTGVLVLAGVIVTQLGVYGVIERIAGRHHPIGIVAGVGACLLLLSSKVEWKWLAWIGGYSAGIFLFHPFTVAGMRAVLRAVGVSDVNILFVGGLLSGIFLSILAVWLFRKVAVGRVVLGEYRRARPAPIEAR
jgi:fucose 4-O-acetylase-like acetyltransferase